jgi:hypothetical protein
MYSITLPAGAEPGFRLWGESQIDKKKKKKKKKHFGRAKTKKITKIRGKTLIFFWGGKPPPSQRVVPPLSTGLND